MAVAAEMLFASRLEVNVNLSGDVLSELFNEELGAVVQIKADDLESVKTLFTHNGLIDCVFEIGTVGTHENQRLNISNFGEIIYSATRADLQKRGQN